MKCNICGKKIEETFLGKIKGAYKGRGKKRKAICSECQKNLSKEMVRPL